MDPDTYRHISGLLTVVGLGACLYLVSWQLRLGPSDRQKWSATFFLTMLALTMGQLSLAYFEVASFGMGWRGLLTYTALIISLVGLAYETRRYNLGVLRKHRHNDPAQEARHDR